MTEPSARRTIPWTDEKLMTDSCNL